MAEETTTKTETGYTEQQLRDRFIGKPVWDDENTNYKVKIAAYKELDVYALYSTIRTSLKPPLTDSKGYIDQEFINHIAVLMIDTYLIRKARGEQVELPQPLVPKNVQVVGGKAAEPVMPLFNIEDFGENADAEIDVVKDLNWIYKNIAVKNPKPKDAPSPGAFAHLQYIQLNDQNMLDFYTKVYPRLIPAKSQLDAQGKFNDDNRQTFDLLERLQRESTDSPGQISVL